MIVTLALRNVRHRPWRSAFLFLGYGIGVAVMIVLLSVGEALLAQARDERLVGGGSVTVLPVGLDIEVMKTGGIGGLFFSIMHGRFVQRQLLASPRLAPRVTAVAPQIDGKLLYLRTPDGSEHAVRASGEIPSAMCGVGVTPVLVAGRWTDDDNDRRWLSPSPAELLHEIDRFHRPPDDTPDAASWAEWHYVNVLSHDRKRWAFISLIVAGDVPDGEWGGQVLVTLQEEGRPARRFSAMATPANVRFSTTDANVSIGVSSIEVLADGRYMIRARATAEGGGAETVTVALTVAPARGAYFPGVALGDAVVSGYAVAGLRAEATGSICVASRCERYDGAQAYKDHNWGTWRGVTWEWGAARAGSYTLLYGRVYPPPDSGGAPTAETPLFVYVVDSLGFLAVFRPRTIAYEDARRIVVNGESIRVPARAEFFDTRDGDTLRVHLEIEDATATDMRRSFVERGDPGSAARLTTPWFVQMKGTARLRGRVAGVPIAGEGTGFFESWR